MVNFKLPLLQVLTKLFFYNGSQWGKKAEFNHSEGEQPKVVKVGTCIETSRKQASKK